MEDIAPSIRRSIIRHGTACSPMLKLISPCARRVPFLPSGLLADLASCRASGRAGAVIKTGVATRPSPASWHQTRPGSPNPAQHAQTANRVLLMAASGATNSPQPWPPPLLAASSSYHLPLSPGLFLSKLLSGLFCPPKERKRKLPREGRRPRRKEPHKGSPGSFLHSPLFH